MNSGLLIRDCQDVDTASNRTRDLTGSRERILRRSSSGSLPRQGISEGEEGGFLFGLKPSAFAIFGYCLKLYTCMLIYSTIPEGSRIHVAAVGIYNYVVIIF